MLRRLSTLPLVAVITALGWSAVVKADTPRIPFQIATGSTTGTFFPVGEAIAGLISHPPGVTRC
ncbi:MAG TPA: hypothetical protein VN685_01810, partial [Rhizomicrobium sp.]|nr:hypothetical protein [Rhizomicrobium sp.]